MSFENWIEERMEVTNEDIKAYFNGAKQYRGIYFIEMKRQLVEMLVKQGLRQREICQLLKLSTSMISIHKNRTLPLDDKSVELIKENKDAWIKEGLYPKSKSIITSKDYHQNCYTTFDLVKPWQL
jgi:predicted transcriptional regulator